MTGRGTALLIESPALSNLEPAPALTASLSVRQRKLLFDAIEAAVGASASTPVVARHGIPSFGVYCLEDLSPVVSDGNTWRGGIVLTEADAEALKTLTRELVRALGTSCWEVGEDGGFLSRVAHGTGSERGLPFTIPGLPSEVEAVLRDAGPEEIGPGVWDIRQEPEED